MTINYLRSFMIRGPEGFTENIQSKSQLCVFQKEGYHSTHFRYGIHFECVNFPQYYVLNLLTRLYKATFFLTRIILTELETFLRSLIFVSAKLTYILMFHMIINFERFIDTHQLFCRPESFIKYISLSGEKTIFSQHSNFS